MSHLVVAAVAVMIQHLGRPIVDDLVDLAVVEVIKIQVEVLAVEPQVKEMLEEMPVEVPTLIKVVVAEALEVLDHLVLVVNMAEMDYNS